MYHTHLRDTRLRVQRTEIELAVLASTGWRTPGWCSRPLGFDTELLTLDSDLRWLAPGSDTGRIEPGSDMGWPELPTP